MRLQCVRFLVWALAALTLLAPFAHGQGGQGGQGGSGGSGVGGVQGLAPRQTVNFELNRTTSFGQSVFVVGDLPELGSNSTALAVKLSPAAYPVWRGTVSLPAGRSYTYRFITRSDQTGQQNSAATTVAGPFNASTPDQDRPMRSKALWLTWNIENPVLWWRPASPTSGGAFVARPMSYFGPAVAGRTGEKQWFTWGFHVAGEAFDYYFTDANGNNRYPASGNYSTNLDGVFVQDGQAYTYIPAASVSVPRRDYSPASVPTLFSPQLNQTRGYRVFLPRGYAEHADRRYPVLYMHDGQNVFDQGTFGSWNAGPTLTALQADGRMDEIIVVGLDNVGDTRRSDYSPPSDLGRADRYVDYIVNTVKPHIDGGYRTLTDAANTAAMGSSMGGVVSLYMGYDFNNRFKRVGAMSTAFWIVPGLTSYIRTQPARDLKIYMDSGDSGSTSGGNNGDGYWDSYNTRDALMGGLPAKYALEGSMRYVIGFGQVHNESAWAARLPGSLMYLFPGQGAPNTLLREVFGPHWDVNGDGVMSLDDLYEQATEPRDLNSDGVADQGDSQRLERFLRRLEATRPGV
jgi:predicted alpha/beta superfamily hydrolase